MGTFKKNKNTKNAVTFFSFVLEFRLVYELTLVFVTATLKCKIKLEKNTQEKIKKTLSCYKHYAIMAYHKYFLLGLMSQAKLCIMFSVFRETH